MPVGGIRPARTFAPPANPYNFSDGPRDDLEPDQLLSIGNVGTPVFQLQADLRAAGFAPEAMSGVFDDSTRRALLAFQKKQGLEQTGTSTLETYRALRAAGVRTEQELSFQHTPFTTKVLELARKHVGFSETDNVNPFSKFFGRPPEAWCADFVSWCFTKAGKPLNECYTPKLLNLLKRSPAFTFTRDRPEPGSIIMFRYQNSTVPANHTGLVERVYMRGGSMWVDTIEGNSHDAVERRSYPVDATFIAGFGTPKA